MAQRKVEKQILYSVSQPGSIHVFIKEHRCDLDKREHSKKMNKVTLEHEQLAAEGWDGIMSQEQKGMRKMAL